MFGSRAIHAFTIHTHPTAEAVAVRESYAILAFILGPIWLLYHRAYRMAAFTALLAAILYGIEQQGWLSSQGLQALSLGLWVWVASEARDWQRDALTREGYSFAAIVMAEDAERALLRYFSHATPASAIHALDARTQA